MRVIYTLDQLNALPIRSIISINKGDEVLTKVAEDEYVSGPHKVGDHTWIGQPEDVEEYLPVVVVFNPAEPITPEDTVTPLLEMVRKMDERKPGTSGYATYRDEVISILNGLSTLVPASITSDSPVNDHPDNVSVIIRVGFTLSRQELTEALERVAPVIED